MQVDVKFYFNKMLFIFFQSALTNAVSSRARARRFHMKDKKKLQVNDGAKSGTSSIFDQCEIEVSSNSHNDITDELYEHLREECYKRADEGTSSAIKGMLRQTYGRRYVGVEGILMVFSLQNGSIMSI